MYFKIFVLREKNAFYEQLTNKKPPHQFKNALIAILIF